MRISGERSRSFAALTRPYRAGKLNPVSVPARPVTMGAYTMSRSTLS